VKHQDIVRLAKTELTDAEKSSNILAYLINKKTKGLATAQDL